MWRNLSCGNISPHDRFLHILHHIYHVEIFFYVIYFPHIFPVETLLHMTIFHMEIFFHMTIFFSTSTAGDAGDKYQVCAEHWHILAHFCLAILQSYSAVLLLLSDIFAGVEVSCGVWSLEIWSSILLACVTNGIRWRVPVCLRFHKEAGFFLLESAEDGTLIHLGLISWRASVLWNFHFIEQIYLLYIEWRLKTPLMF